MMISRAIIAVWAASFPVLSLQPLTHRVRSIRQRSVTGEVRVATNDLSGPSQSRRAALGRLLLLAGTPVVAGVRPSLALGTFPEYASFNRAVSQVVELKLKPGEIKVNYSNWTGGRECR